MRGDRHFDLSELLNAVRAGGDIDVIGRGVELVLQALIETEGTEVIGAGRTNAARGALRGATGPATIARLRRAAAELPAQARSRRRIVG